MKEPLSVQANTFGFIHCPYCGCMHWHDVRIGNGMRLAYCMNKINTRLVAAKGGNVYNYKDGYYVVFAPLN